MNLFRFEAKKMIKQKKYLWLILVITLITAAILSLNTYQRSRLQSNWAMHRTFNQVQELVDEWEGREAYLIRTRDRVGLTEDQELQLKYIKEVGLALVRIRITVRYGDWIDIPKHEKTFWDNLQKYVSYGGEFTVLEGIDRDIAIAKNAWLFENNLAYEYELFPVTPHLFLVESSAFLLAIVGLAILLFFYGNTITEEKEYTTWNTIKTQPVSSAKIILSKYSIYLIITLFFISMVLVIGAKLPNLLNGSQLRLEYPQVLITGEDITLISTQEFLLRSSVLFMCVSSLVVSISMVASKWTKRSISSFILVSIVIAIGYFATSMFDTHSNPFYLFRFNEILRAVPQDTDRLYILSSVVWSCVFLATAAILPEQEIKLVQVIEKKVKNAINTKKQFSRGKTRMGKRILLGIRKFEWRKVKREGILKSIVLFLLVVILAGYSLLTTQTEQKKNEYLSELQYRVGATQESRKQYEQVLEDLQEERKRVERELDMPPHWYGEWNLQIIDEQIKKVEKTIEEETKHHELVIGALAAYENNDWKTFSEYQQFVVQLTIDRTYAPGQLFHPETFGRFTKLVSIHEKKLMLEHNIQPVFSGEFIPTIHQLKHEWVRKGWGGEEVTQAQTNEENKKIDNSGLFFLHLAYKNYLYFIPLLMLLFFIGSGLSKEKGKKMTFNFLRTQPISLGKIYVAKIINSTMIIIGFTLLIPMFMVLVGYLYNRLGDWNYPILHYNSYRIIFTPEYTGYNAGYGYHFITLGQYLVNSTLILISIALFINAISTFLSLFFKKSLNVLTITMLITLGGFWLNESKPLRMSYLSPFTYFNIPKVVNGQIATLVNDPRVNTQTGLILLCGIAVLLLITGYLIMGFKNLGVRSSNKVKVVKKEVPNDTIS